ncbi:MAG: hypothetical protein H7263_00830 [Candidatus Sericytochromatia bacterium]|nr:hypothetical protein [Candidatus Sericytochromatia bacterium]
MNYQKKLSEIKKLIAQNSTQIAMQVIGVTFEVALRDLYKQVLATVPLFKRERLTESESKFSAGKGINHVGLGQLVGLYRHCKILELLKTELNLPIKLFKIETLDPIIDARNESVHDGKDIDKEIILYALNQLVYLLKETKLISDSSLLSNEVFIKNKKVLLTSLLLTIPILSVVLYPNMIPNRVNDNILPLTTKIDSETILPSEKPSILQENGNSKEVTIDGKKVLFLKQSKLDTETTVASKEKLKTTGNKTKYTYKAPVTKAKNNNLKMNRVLNKDKPLESVLIPRPTYSKSNIITANSQVLEKKKELKIVNIEPSQSGKKEISVLNNIKRVAVLYFDNNNSSSELDPLKKGLTDMIITDLNSANSVKVIEREKLNSILNELNLEKKEVFNKNSTQKIGKLLGVEYLVMGSFFELLGQFRIDAKLIRVETGEIISSEGLNGTKENFTDLEKKLVLKIIEGMDARFESQDKEDLLRQNGLTWKQVINYSDAIELFDNGKKAESKEKVLSITKDTPDFKPANNLLKKL